MTDAYIVSALRTPVGRRRGGLSSIHPADLSAHVIAGVVDRSGIDPSAIDDVIWGCVNQVGAQAFNVGRTAVLSAGLPESVPATTIDRQCGSSQQAAHFAAQGVIAGAYDLVIAGGVESMSRVPLGSSTHGGVRSALLEERYPEGLVGQGVSAELIAHAWGLSRTDLDEYAAQSHRRAAEAWRRGDFDGQLVEVPDADGSGMPMPNHRILDETVRPGTTVEDLSGLSPAFRTEETAARFPDLDWRITAGNSSPLTDGASAVLIASEEKATALGLRPRARFHSFAVVGDDPLMMLTGPIPATRRVLDRSGLAIEDLDAYEVNEAFASVPLAWERELHADPARLNPWGGAIALGHALGSSGTRLLGTLVAHLEASGGRYGLQTMCEGGGMANAMIVERL